VAAELDCPVLGVKVGRLGFLTEVEPTEALDLIRDASPARPRSRSAWPRPRGREGETSFVPQWGLNEIMVEKRARHRLVRLAVEVDGEYVTTFSADGVVVATPTGSTAYSFSARGPIVSPGCPVSRAHPDRRAHGVRPLVRPGADQQVILEVVGDEPGLLSADGRESVELPVGSRARIAPRSLPARLVRPRGRAAVPRPRSRQVRAAGGSDGHGRRRRRCRSRG
jgi:NAD+ kinase